MASKGFRLLAESFNVQHVYPSKCGKDTGTYIRYVEELAMQLVSDGTSRDKTTNTTSTIDSGSHFSHMFSTTEHYPSIFGAAKQCKYHNTRVRTTYGCQGCKVFMCPAPCFGKYHLNLTKGRTFASHTTTSVSVLSGKNVRRGRPLHSQQHQN